MASCDCICSFCSSRDRNSSGVTGNRAPQLANCVNGVTPEIGKTGRKKSVNQVRYRRANIWASWLHCGQTACAGGADESSETSVRVPKKRMNPRDFSQRGVCHGGMCHWAVCRWRGIFGRCRCSDGRGCVLLTPERYQIRRPVYRGPALGTPDEWTGWHSRMIAIGP